PDQADFEPDGTTLRIEVPDRSWLLRLGRMTGDDRQGEAGDSAALEVLEGLDGVEPDAVIRGPASEIDLWLWRRGDLAMTSIDGDRAVAERVSEIAAGI
ncbi:MAG: hypothetical protein WBM50_27500, partial [Acidimicrobiales bacterium]